MIYFNNNSNLDIIIKLLILSFEVEIFIAIFLTKSSAFILLSIKS